ncbi:hypothetical protein [Methanobrevibacter oralis]|uniref:hypothetical protein n=1 Tax=Methanobrevibacter oralis TaxID=66851 RepID=UPI001FD569CF|nr:hypothetical protein [Methanobrevibacter oralis]
MVLKDDTINQTMLVPMDLSNLIPEGHPSYFIKNVVDQIDCSEANKEFFVISLVKGFFFWIVLRGFYLKLSIYLWSHIIFSEDLLIFSYCFLEFLFVC